MFSKGLVIIYAQGVVGGDIWKYDVKITFVNPLLSVHANIYDPSLKYYGFDTVPCYIGYSKIVK